MILFAMKNFWSYISNNKIAVGCTGGIVYVYDTAGTELAKFRDLSYAYRPLLSPDGTLLAVKSTAGLLAFYSLTDMRLLKKFRFTPLDGCQDGNMCFSPDGTELFNIEVSEAGDARITVYSVKNFSSVAELCNKKEAVPLAIERNGNALYILGGKRDSNDILCSYFTARLDDKALREIHPVSDKDADLCRGFVHLQNCGFTKKAKEWSALRYAGYDLTGIEQKDYSIFRLWKEWAFLDYPVRSKNN